MSVFSGQDAKIAAFGRRRCGKREGLILVGNPAQKEDWWTPAKKEAPWQRKKLI